jgi:hypothetical protein
VTRSPATISTDRRYAAILAGVTGFVRDPYETLSCAHNYAGFAGIF